ncbi:xyloside xylosyltransferase 1 isoform X1 [Tympanuchus pallidicinctus]|uniref:xyloside xylosyltransferase 1 n=1 Tax=Lagopus leucura TaxID=30410 RepID=UPI001C67AB92|nr:xyloside xylosyltransferase 1 [Lagopus leucura]XP_052541140.1 xyloside xylosyltransferase 1 isoform X1 [Tympanuchus pallidicinctus]
MGWARSQPCALALAAALAVCAFYYLGGGGETFSSATRRLRATRAAAPPATPPGPARRERTAAGGEAGRALHLLMMFTKVERSPALRGKGQAALRSLLRHGRLRRGDGLHLHLVTDSASRDVGEELLRDAMRGAAFRYQVIIHDVSELTEKLFPIVEAMQKHFSAGSGTYYSDSIFFLSVAMHRIMPKEITQIIQVDLDLKYKANIRDLFEEFDNFQEGAVIGIAREMQPVYRHTFWQYRRENPQTRVGEPPPDGLPGFNSGVLLLNLEAMRRSKLYNQLLEPGMVQKLTEKYHFKGHLGDQDFFTMVGMEHPELFHVLDCTWNRQLCTWWKDHGYSDVFDQYFRCDGEVKIYHGNCNTPIPED